MTTISSNYGGGVDPNASTQVGGQQSLGQADFLRLMTTQMQNQDPLKPMDGTQMLAQLAQFSTVQGIEGLNASMGAMANVMESDQTLRAAAMVGHEVYVEADSFTHAKDGSVKGEVMAERAGPIQVDILDADGKRIARRTLQAEASGAVAFEWDGKDDAGNTVTGGKYSIKAVTEAGEKPAELSVRLAGRVENVSIENYALSLNVPGLGDFSLAQVRRIS